MGTVYVVVVLDGVDAAVEPVASEYDVDDAVTVVGVTGSVITTFCDDDAIAPGDDATGADVSAS